ncbi:MAG: hypothetical protein QF593_12100, partial [Nitrospinota bacterium]|nr:hypothetical protein [Nitrospinota bacterium]
VSLIHTTDSKTTRFELEPIPHLVRNDSAQGPNLGQNTNPSEFFRNLLSFTTAESGTASA